MGDSVNSLYQSYLKIKEQQHIFYKKCDKRIMISKVQPKEFVSELLLGCGFVKIKNFFNDIIINKVSESIDYLSSKKGHAFEPRAIRLWNFYSDLSQYDIKTWIDYFGDKNLYNLLSLWMGAYLRYSAQVNILKKGYLGHWIHQDYPVGLYSKDFVKKLSPVQYQSIQHFSLQVLIAHDEMTPSNGALKVLPASQLWSQAQIINFSSNSFTEFFNTECHEICMSPGDALFYNPHLIHCTGDLNDGEQRRAALILATSPFLVPMEKTNFSCIQEQLDPYLKSQLVMNKISKEDVKRLLQISSDPCQFPMTFSKSFFDVLVQNNPLASRWKKLKKP